MADPPPGIPPPAIRPDHADWTWVLERPCPECGFAAAAVAGAGLGAATARPEGASDRRGHRRDGATGTVECFGRHLLHDPVHHRHDVGRGYERLAAGC